MVLRTLRNAAESPWWFFVLPFIIFGTMFFGRHDLICEVQTAELNQEELDKLRANEDKTSRLVALTTGERNHYRAQCEYLQRLISKAQTVLVDDDGK